MQIIKCDKCGKEYEANKEERDLLIHFLPKVKPHVDRSYTGLNLCDACIDELREWLCL